MLGLDFLGKKAMKDLQMGSSQYQNQITQAGSGAQKAYQLGGDQAQGFIQPFAQAGQDVLGLRQDYFGLNGPEANQNFWQTAMANSGYQPALEAGINALDASAAAQGGLYSGAHAKDLTDYGMRNFSLFANPFVQNVMGASSEGTNVAGQQGQIAQNTARLLGDTIFGEGQLLANNQMATANAMAKSRAIPMQNALGLGNVLASFMPWNSGGGQAPQAGSVNPTWSTSVYPA